MSSRADRGRHARRRPRRHARVHRSARRDASGRGGDAHVLRRVHRAARRRYRRVRHLPLLRHAARQRKLLRRRHCLAGRIPSPATAAWPTTCCCSPCPTSRATWRPASSRTRRTTAGRARGVSRADGSYPLGQAKLAWGWVPGGLLLELGNGMGMRLEAGTDWSSRCTTTPSPPVRT